MKKWIAQAEKSLIKTPVFEVFESNRRSDDGKKSFDFYFLRTHDWVNILPVTTEGKIVMVRQYRIGNENYTLEFPGGVLEPEDKHPKDAALRELLEETGYAPVSGAKFIQLGPSFPNPAIQANQCYSFAVGPVEKRFKQKLDTGEMIDVVEMTPEELTSDIQSGKMTHALMLVTAFFLIRKTQSVSEAFLSELKALASL